MTEKILSQDEVDALLKGVQTGDIETEEGVAEAGEVQPFDIMSQERIIRGRMPGLEMANEKFSRLFRNSLSSIVMKFVDVSIHNVEMMMFSEFMKTVPLPASITLFRMEPLKGYALFIMEAPMVFAMIEYFFGGPTAKHVKSEGRYFTPIEQRIIKKISELALDDLASAWSSLVPIRPEYVGLEMNPQFVSIVTATEGVIKIDIRVEVEGFVGKVFFCIPYSMVEPIREKLVKGIRGEYHERDQRWITRLKEVLMGSAVEVVAELGQLELTLGDLMNMEVGNILTMGKPVSEDVVLKVENVPKFMGTIGVSRGNQALKITGYL